MVELQFIVTCDECGCFEEVLSPLHREPDSLKLPSGWTYGDFAYHGSGLYTWKILCDDCSSEC